MYLKQKLSKIRDTIHHIPHKTGMLLGFLGLFLIVFIAAFLVEKPVSFSYAGETCVRQLSLLPDHLRTVDSSNFTAEHRQFLQIGSLKLASLQTCFTATRAPQPGMSKVSVALFNDWFAKKTFAMTVDSSPIAYSSQMEEPVPAGKPLEITLDQPDVIFDYQLAIDDRFANCGIRDRILTCDIESLQLVQGTKYNVELLRLFNDEKAGSVLQKEITTLLATSVVTSSVTDNQIVYDKPQSFVVTFDKDITDAVVYLHKITNADPITIPLDVDIEGKQATARIIDNLERETTYVLGVQSVKALDGSTLVNPYIVNFATAGGPKVTNVSIGKTGVPASGTIVLTFDQPLLADQDITKYVGITAVPIKLSKNANTITIAYSSLAKCADISLNVAAGLQNSYGVNQTTAWSYSSRTLCQTVSTIGYSKQGRAILSYTFGSGSKTILYTGTIHGNELSSKSLMQLWVNELEANARNIPSDKKIVVVPSLNPDGVVANTRNNASNVDLNRNFDTSDWQTDIYSPSNQLVPGGGGSSPMSEIESQVIASLTIQLQPRLTMSFHSSAAYAIANQAGDSSALAAKYADLSGYRNMTGVSGAFSYPITGTYDDWIAEKLGLPSVLIELSSSTNAEFSRNVDALWAMAKS